MLQLQNLCPQYSHIAENSVHRRARLEHELDLREREEALELNQLELEREEEEREQSSKTTHAAQVLGMLEQLTDDEIAAVRNRKVGFQEPIYQ